MVVQSRAVRTLVLLITTGCCSCGAATPGDVISLARAATPTATVAIPVVPIPAVRPRANVGPAVPALRDILDQLNADTVATAEGEHLILQQLSEALRTQLEGLLNRVGG